MIRLTLEFTDNLGPEADLAPLLKRFDDTLHAAPIQGAHVLVDCRCLVDYVSDSADGAWATVMLTLRGPDSLEAALAPLRGAILDLLEAHMSDLFLRHSIHISSRLELYPAASEAERRHQRGPGPGF